MRIGLIAGEYPPLQGGLGDFTRQLALAFAASGHEPHVLTKCVAGQPAQAVEHGVSVHRLVASWGWRTYQRIEGFKATVHLDVLNLQYQAAAYQMHPAINLLPGALARHLPAFVTFHDLRVPYLFPKAGILRWKSILIMAKGATACIATNAEDRDRLLAEGVQSMFLIPIGSNIAPAPLKGFDRATWAQASGIDPSGMLVGYFGFMNDSKGGDTLIQAIGQLRQTGHAAGLLHIGAQTGDSDPTNAAYAAKLEQLARDLGIADHIHRTGFLDENGVSAAFAACDVVALPYRDGASFRRGTLMAALAHTCAIVTTTPSVSVSELRDGENVLLVPPDDPPALAAAIARIQADDGLRRRLQLGAGELSKQFGWDAIARETVNAYETALRGGRRSW